MNGHRNIFTHVTSWLTSKNRDQLRKPMIGNRVWVIFSFFTPIFAASLSGNKYDQVREVMWCLWEYMHYAGSDVAVRFLQELFGQVREFVTVAEEWR